MRYTTIIFDLDGTLLETGRGVFNGISYALQKLGRQFPQNFDRSTLIGPPLRYGFHKLLGLPEDQIEDAVAIYREYYAATGIHEAEPYPGVVELLEELDRAGANVCLATAKYGVLAEKQLNSFNLARFFKHTAMSKESEATTTKSQMVSSLLTACGCAASNAVMIGDTKYDAMGALSNGVPFIGVLYGYGSKEDMEQSGAGLFASDIRQLRGMLLDKA